MTSDGFVADPLMILDSMPGLVALLSSTGEVEVVNRRILEYFGQTVEQLRQWGTNDTIHPDDLPHVIDAFTNAMASGNAYAIVQRFKRSDGVYRWFQNSGCPLRTADGRIGQWCVLLTDIDDRKRAEDAIRAREQELTMIVDTIPAMAWSARPDGTGEFFNQHYLDFVGLSSQQAADWGWAAAVHPDDLNMVTAAWQRIIASEAPGEGEVRLRRHDGVYRWFLFRANPLRDSTGAVVKWYGVNTDIDERKQVADALRRSENFLRQIQGLSHTGGWRYDVAADVVESSPEIQRFCDIQPGEDITRPRFWFDRIHPDDRSRVEEEFARCMRKKTEYQSGYRIALPNGHIRYHYATGHPIVGDSGDVAEVIGAVMDMTEYWRTTNELARASDALRELQTEIARAAHVATVGEFAASMAHEVNQPLSGIITNANTCLRMLAADPPNIEGARETAKRAVRDGNRAAEVVARLRSLFSNEELRLESFDLNDATREVIALSLNELRQKRIDPRTQLADDLPAITGDRLQVQQVILNLVRNGSDAMNEVEDRPRQLVIRTERESDDRVRVSISDAGIGIDLQNVDKLFDAFYTTKSGGMGVGLSVSRSIVERHGGRLWAEPNEGPGTTFSFSLPIAQSSIPSIGIGDTFVQ